MINHSQRLTNIVQNSALGTLSARDIKVAEHTYNNAVALTAAGMITKLKECREAHCEGSIQWNILDNAINELKKEYTRFFGLAMTGKINVGGSNA